MWKKLLSGLIGGPLESYIDYRKRKKELQHELELEVLRGKAEYERAKTQRASESEGRDHEWELESIRNSGWKDEWVLVLLSIPLVLVFVPYTQDVVLQGFETLDKTPDWYRWLTVTIFGAIYGLRIWRRKL